MILSPQIGFSFSSVRYTYLFVLLLCGALATSSLHIFLHPHNDTQCFLCRAGSRECSLPQSPVSPLPPGYHRTSLVLLEGYGFGIPLPIPLLDLAPKQSPPGLKFASSFLS